MKTIALVLLLGLAVGGCAIRGQLIDSQDDYYCQRQQSALRSYQQCRRDVAVSRGDGGTINLNTSQSR